jgi:hypothetical protein
MDIYANRLIQQLATVVGQWQEKKGKGEKILRYKAKIGRPSRERRRSRARNRKNILLASV